MVKNDVLLRVLLYFGFFWIFKLGFEFVTMFLGWFRWKTNWFAIVSASICALTFHRRTYTAIIDSIITRGRLTTTVRWLLYVLLGYGFYISIIKMIETGFYSQYGIWYELNSANASDKFKVLALILAALAGSFFITKTLVPQIGFLETTGFTGETLKSKEHTGTVPGKRSTNDKATIHGSAKFSDVNQFDKKFNGVDTREMAQRFEQYGGYVFQPILRYVPHAHAVTIAGAGQGKGTTTIISNLLTQPYDNWIVLDIKGENAAVTARFQRERGQSVHILDPFDVQKAIGAAHGITSSGYNPLDVAKYLPEEEKSDFAAMLAEMFVPESKEHGSSDNFFTDSARNTIKTYILHLITDEEIQGRHLGKLYQWLRLNQEEEVKLWVDMEYNEHTKYAVNEFKTLAISAPQTWGGIIANARRATAFLESPIIQRSLSKSDFDPMRLQDSAATVYVILPERNLNTHKTWLRIVFGTILKLCNFIARKRVNFLMDEFPILGRMDDFLRAYAFGRGQKISCWIFAQSLSQLRQIYGEDGLNTFMSNARLRQFFGVNDIYTQTIVSDMLGFSTEITSTQNKGSSKGSSTNNTTNTISFNTSAGNSENLGSSSGESEQLIQRKLMLPDEVGNLKDQFILFVDGDKYLLPKYPYYMTNFYYGRFDPNPYVGH